MSNLTSKRKEKISAFLDNDMHQDELMSFSLSAEDDDAVQAQRYQLVGDVLRGEMNESSFVDISHAVREALADENIVDQMEVTQSVASAATSPADAQSSSSWSLASLFRPAAGMAVAAAVAVVMVVSVNQQEVGGVAPIASNVEQAPAVQLASDNKLNDDATSSVAVSNSGADVNQSLVNQHLEFATQDTLQGRLPYVRAVNFETEK